MSAYLPNQLSYQRNLKLIYISIFSIIPISVISIRSEAVVGYELSIYTDLNHIAIPLILVGIIVVSLICVFFNKHSNNLILFGGTFLLLYILFLFPILKGYYFIGYDDPMTHVGFTKDIIRNNGFSELLYPGIHVLTSSIYFITGIQSIPYLSMFITSIPLSLFIVFSSLISSRLSERRYLPLYMIISISLVPSGYVLISGFVPRFVASLLLPMLLFTLALNTGSRRELLVVLFSISIIIYHPQIGLYISTALLFSFLLSSITNLKFEKFSEYVSKLSPRSTSAIVICVFFWLYVQSQQRFESQFAWLVSEVLIDTSVGTEAVTRSQSLSELGSGLLDLGIRLFVSEIIFWTLSFCVLILCLIGTVRNKRNIVSLVTLSIIPFVAVAFHGVAGHQLLRPYHVVGGIMTVISCISVSEILKRVQKDWNVSLSNVIIVIAITMIILIAIFSLYPSPLIFQSSHHIPETQVSGYETTFEYGIEDKPVMEMRSDTWRYLDFIHGKHTSELPTHHQSASMPASNFSDQGLSTHETTYLIVTKADIIRDTELFDGIRYTDNDYQYLESAGSINKIYENNDYKLYQIYN